MFENVLLYFMFILNIAGFSLSEYISNLNHVKISKELEVAKELEVIRS